MHMLCSLAMAMSLWLLTTDELLLEMQAGSQYLWTWGMDGKMEAQATEPSLPPGPKLPRSGPLLRQGFSQALRCGGRMTGPQCSRDTVFPTDLYLRQCRRKPAPPVPVCHWPCHPSSCPGPGPPRTLYILCMLSGQLGGPHPQASH